MRFAPRQLVLVFCFPLLAAGLAQQTQPLTLQAALAKAAEQAPVQSAQAELADAQANLQRTLADPLLTRPARLQAEQRLALAQASLNRAKAQAESGIVQAYTQVLEALQQVALAKKSTELAQRNLEVAQIRQKNGSGTALESKNAQARLEDAQRNQAFAEQGLANARSNLRSLVGEFAELAPLPPAPALPERSLLQSLLEQTPDLVQAQQRLELAKLQLELLDPSYAAQAEIEAAKARAEQAEAALREIRRGLSLQYENLYTQAQNAFRALGIQQSLLQNAREQLAADKRRLDSGLISPLAYAQSELAALQAELAALQAQGSYLRALYGLYAGGR
ncbi:MULTISPECIES: TolC family protein [unclassified Meiothermus]|uniref:TolC family protein n=1 Tax=unclassified Meiothermus TaxID=370471 RepID=UPI001F1D7611|nr:MULTISPECIES: TolC family protein [unclassified Meiothermus]